MADEIPFGTMEFRRSATTPPKYCNRGACGLASSFCLPFQARVMPILFRDTETRSTQNLADVGAHRYAADPTTEVLCVGYAVDNGAAQIWTPGQPIPEEFIIAARDPSWLIVAHNDLSKRQSRNACWRHALAGRSFRSSAIAAPWRWRWRMRFLDRWKTPLPPLAYRSRKIATAIA